jgi:hypothetical protein
LEDTQAKIHSQKKHAYADDIADKSLDEEEASEALQQLEAASAFVGLRLNVPKTEVMASGITKAVLVLDKDEPAKKERVEVSDDLAKFRGWKIEAKSANLIGIDAEIRNTSMEIPIAILFDDGEFIFADDRGGGWIRNEDGHAYRMRKLGFEQVAQEKSQDKLTCPLCNVKFDSEKGLKSHKKWCRTFESMTVSEQIQLRRTRQTSSTRRGKTRRKVELISVNTCEGLEAKSCGEFIYLGSKLDTSASATPEIRRRIGMAFTTFGSLGRIWKAKSFSKKTKAALYRAIILSVMLYNAEVWPIQIQDIKALEGAHIRMMRRMMASSDVNEHFSNNQLYAEFSMSTISEVVTQKRLSWIGHALRRPSEDRSRQAVIAALDNKDNIWTKLVKADCQKTGLSFSELQQDAEDRNAFRKRRNISLRHPRAT